MVQKTNLNSILLAIYNLIVLTGTTYLIVMLDWSPWWFAFTYLLLMDFNIRDD